MKLSIIIPVYNSEKYIEDCLNSILVQEHIKDVEILIINDKSTDKSREIISNYEKKYSNISVIDLDKNSGQSIARNIGVKHARGNYIYFVDSDDSISEDFLKNIYSKLLEKKDDIIRIVNVVKDENGNILSEDKINNFNFKVGPEAIYLMYKEGLWIDITCSYIIKRAYWLNNNFKFAEGRLQEDLGLMPLVVLKADKVSLINNSKYYYNLRENSTMTNKNYAHRKKVAYDVIYHYDFLKSAIGDLDKDISNIIFSIIIRAFILNIKFLNKDDKKKYRQALTQRNVISNIKYISLRDVLKKAYYFYKLYIE